MSDSDDDDLHFDNTDCPNCGGEGVVHDCIDGCCIDADEGCELCERRCDWCRPAPARSAASTEAE